MPDFSLRAGDGSVVGLSDFKGKKNIVLYFYPKDDTPGCIKEACGFRDHLDEVREQNAEVLGVSVDGPESHQRFSAKYGLPFTLLSDQRKELTKKLGVLGFGGFVAQRVTFIVDKDGVIRRIFPRVDPSQHAPEVVEVLRRLNAEQRQST